MDKPTQINSEEEHREYLNRIQELFEQDPDPSSEEGEVLNLLIRAVDAYEREHYPIEAIREKQSEWYVVDFFSTNYPHLHLKYRDGASVTVSIEAYVEHLLETLQDDHYRKLLDEDTFTEATKDPEGRYIKWPGEPSIALATSDLRTFVGVPPRNQAISSLEAAHTDSSDHREAINHSDSIGCFYCRTVQPADIQEWIDGDQTALCPSCGIDAVLPGIFDLYTDPQFLKRMYARWFVGPHGVF